jgi:NTE family protein
VGLPFDHPVPAALKTRVSGFPLFAKLDSEAIDALLEVAEWFSLPGGAPLARKGDDDQAIFVVLAGCLGVYVSDAQGRAGLVAHIPAGETVGEMAVLSGEPHSASLLALRDSELLRIAKTDIERLLAAHPSLALSLMRLLIDRLRRTTRKAVQSIRPRTFALVPLQDGLPLERLSRALAHALERMGLRTGLVNPTASGQTSEWFHRFEAGHDIVLYEGDEPDGAWTQLCIRQADRVVLVASAERPVVHHEGRLGQAHSAPEIVLLHAGERMAGAALDIPEAQIQHQLRERRPADVERLARLLTGRGVGLVLAGGGARGFAHIGVIRALRESGMPIDLIGGASMGAIIGACLAMEWSDEEIDERMRRAFVASDPLSDLTWPLLSLLRGRKVERLLQENFGATRIEHLPVRYFCMTSDLTSGSAHAHHSGLLWRALQASVAIPGLLPPVVFDGHLHVDGGIMNNLPIDVMAGYARGPVIGVDVAGDARLDVPADYAEMPRLELLRRLRRGAPGLVHILMRTGTVGNEFHRRAARQYADLLLEPPLEGVGLRDWRNYDEAVAEGYAYTREMIERYGIPTGKSFYDRLQRAS